MTMNHTPDIPIASAAPWPPHKPQYVFSRREFWLALALWIVGYAYVASIPVGSHPLPAMAVQIFLPVGTFVYLTRPRNGGRATPQSSLLVAVGVALALSLLWSTSPVLMAAVTVWNAFSWFFIVLILTGNTADSRERRSEAYLVRKFFVSLSLPFRAPATSFAALFGPRRAPDGAPRPRSRVRGIIGWGALGLLMAGIPTLVVILLLSYDEGFSGIIDQILDAAFTLLSVRGVFRQINNVGFGLLVGFLLFGAMLGGRAVAERARAKAAAQASDDAPAEAPASRRDGAHVAPVALMAALLTPVMAVYVIFFISQWDYYVSAFTGVRPEELTFAHYAREGFFQLVIVAMINAYLGLCAALFSRRRPADPDRPRRNRTHPVIRIYLALLSLMTLVLIATALSKMILYVGTYGMSHKRVYATWLMLLLAVAFVALLLRQLWARMNLTSVLAAVFLVFFLVLSLVPVDALIVRYNVNAALDGNLRTMQGDVCSDSGMAGVLPALDFMASTATDIPSGCDPEQLASVRAATDEYLIRMTAVLEEMDWYEHNITTWRAMAALERAGYRVPDGTPLP